jgi:hypothetical protein
MSQTAASDSMWCLFAFHVNQTVKEQFAISAHIISSCVCSLYFAILKERLGQSKTRWPGTVQIKIGTSSVTKMRHVPILHLHLHNWHFFLPGITNTISNEHF